VNAVPQYRVTALKMGSLGADRSALVFGREPGTAVEIPVWAAAIEGNGMKILVDTGIRDPAWVRETLGPCEQASDETLEGALERIGWRTDDVDLLVNTHLHYDHVGFNSLLAHAPIYVSASEWEATARPIGPQQTVLYEPREWLAEPLSPFNYRIVCGDYNDVAPGVRTIATPGHSVGHQSVLVNTAEGVLCVVGDAVNVEENFTTATPGGIHVSIEDALASTRRVARSCDRVLMAHDPRISKYQDEAFPPVSAMPAEGS
jgi:N-acyl homoserine lactone hydrolase